ncbi:MAG: DUF2889 domain-containing protein [Bacillota bacterium]
MEIFNRCLFINAVKLNDHTVQVKSTNLDSVHEFTIILVVDVNDRLIKSAKAEVQRAPYAMCFDVGSLVDQAVGWNIDEGVGKKAREAFVGSQGCFRILDTFLEAVKAVYQSDSAFIQGEFEEMLGFYHERNKGTCYGHNFPLEDKIKKCLPMNTIDQAKLFSAEA